MASIIQPSDEKKAMPDEALSGDDAANRAAPPPDAADAADVPAAPSAAARKATAGPGGYFTIYKKGQGYWTRMGTVIGLGMVIAFTSYNLYEYVPTFLPASMSEGAAQRVGLLVAVTFLIASAAVGYWLTNKPTNVDFLIATDSEMKKVNWTSRRELIGSTKVVILFMFTVTLFLFLVDVLFGYLFYLIGVLRSGPFA